MKIGVISDTHGRFDRSIPTVFDGVDAIIHAGDIGKLDVIERLREIAPVFAVEGNNDSFGEFPIERIVELAGRKVLIRHILGELHQLHKSEWQLLDRVEPDIVVFGHSHRPYKHKLGKTLLFNPGSAGPRRFSLPRTVGILTLNRSAVRSRIIDLG